MAPRGWPGFATICARVTCVTPAASLRSLTEVVTDDPPRSADASARDTPGTPASGTPAGGAPGATFSFVDPEHGWLLIPGAALLRTTDGKLWTVLDTAPL